MRSPTCIVSTLRRWRLFRPWIVNPCSRVFRKLSGELTIIQNCEARPSVRPDFRLRRGRPDLAGLSPAGAAGVSGVSDTTEIVSLLRKRGRSGGQLSRIRQQNRQVPDLGDMGDLVARHHPADLEQRDVAGARIPELAVPLVLAPAMEQVDCPSPDASEVLEGFLEGSRELVVMAGIDGRPYVRAGNAIQVRM